MSLPKATATATRAQRIGALAIALLLAAPIASFATDSPAGADSADPDEFRETIDMSPDDKIGWTLRNAFAPVTGLFLGGPSYWYEPRRIEVDTTPSGGMVDLFYVRSNFQKRFEQAEAPVTVMLPKRIDAGPRDSVTIRAFHEGYRQKSLTFKMSGREKEVVIDLEPLPNTLEALSHRYFAGRSSVSFKTKERLEFRVQDTGDGFTVILNETARSAEATASMDGIRSPLIEEAFGQQLGEDLLVQFVLSEEAQSGKVDVRSRQDYDAARDLYAFTVDLVPSDGEMEARTAAIAALKRIQPSAVGPCAMIYDSEMHEKLDPGSLNRALAPNGDFTDRYLRAAMRRLGELVPGGVVHFTDGAEFRPTVPIELEASLSQAGGAEGYLAILRTFVGELEAKEHQRETLRSLIAPELDATLFSSFIDGAEGLEHNCLASR